MLHNGNPLRGLERGFVSNAYSSDAPWQWNGLIAAYPFFVNPTTAAANADYINIPLLGSNPPRMKWRVNTYTASEHDPMPTKYGLSPGWGITSSGSPTSFKAMWAYTERAPTSEMANVGAYEIIYQRPAVSNNLGLVSGFTGGTASLSFTSYGTSNLWLGANVHSGSSSSSITVTTNLTSAMLHDVTNHVMFTWDSTGTALYLNGTRIGTSSTVSGLNPSTTEIVVANSVGSTGSSGHTVSIQIPFFALYGGIPITPQWVAQKAADPYGFMRKHNRRYFTSGPATATTIVDLSAGIATATSSAQLVTISTEVSITPGTASATSSGITPTLVYDQTVTESDTATATASGITPTITTTVTVVPDTGSATASGVNPDIVTVLSLDISGTATATATGTNVTATPGDVAVTMSGVALATGTVQDVDAYIITITEVTDTAVATGSVQDVTATPGAVSVTTLATSATGSVQDVTASGGAVTVVPDAGSSIASVQDVTTASAVSIVPDAGSATASGQDVITTTTVTIVPDAGSATASGQDVTISTTVSVVVDVATGTATAVDTTAGSGEVSVTMAGIALGTSSAADVAVSTTVTISPDTASADTIGVDVDVVTGAVNVVPDVALAISAVVAVDVDQDDSGNQAGKRRRFLELFNG